MTLPYAGEIPANAKHHWHHQENAEQLNDYRCVTGPRRDCVTGADNLGDIVNSATQHDADGLLIETKQDAERGIEQHGQRGERVDRDHDEGDIGLLAGIIRHDGGDRQCRGCAAHSRTDADQRSETSFLPAPARKSKTGRQGRHHRDHDQRGRSRPKGCDIAEADS